MTECESMLKELEEKRTRFESAKEAATAPRATEREVSDCRMLEQEYMGLCKRTKALVEKSGTDADKRKMAQLESAAVH